ncbi:hypothetical protein EAN04_24685 [Salmonella enterica]|nr:hypothetical protein [Salmonella enterica]
MKKLFFPMLFPALMGALLGYIIIADPSSLRPSTFVVLDASGATVMTGEAEGRVKVKDGELSYIDKTSGKRVYQILPRDKAYTVQIERHWELN